MSTPILVGLCPPPPQNIYPFASSPLNQGTCTNSLSTSLPTFVYMIVCIA